MRLSRKYAYAAVTAAILAVPLAVAPPATASGHGRSAITASVPNWARAGHAVGKVAHNTKIRFMTVLPLRDIAAATALAASVSDPNSPSYGRYVSADEFNRRFAPTDAQVDDVRAYLKSQGFAVTGVAQGNRWVSATGTAAQINRAFGVTLRKYSFHGRTLKSPDRPVTVPSTIKPLIQGIVGLDDSGLLRRPATGHATPGQPSSGKVARSPVQKPKVTPPSSQSCSTYWNQHHQTVPSAYGKTMYPTYICGYTPSQLRSAYSVTTSGRTGAGVTVAIIDAYASPTMLSDANKYARHVGDSQFASGQYVEQIFQPFDLTSECGEEGWNGEETLDVEAVHGIAPGAKVYYVGARDCADGLDEAMNWVIQHEAADIVSNSWGGIGEGVSSSEHALESGLFLQAAAEGIGFYFSSGDSGDEYLLGNTDSPQPDYPASDANVTAVGGTSLAINSHGAYQFETSWGTYIDPVSFSGAQAVYTEPLPGEFLFGAGGGTSTLAVQPSYQKQVVPASLSKANGATAMRVVPDVAAVADPYTGFEVGQTVDGVFQYESIGGTSLACPVFAGIQALVSQGRTVSLGFANPLIYQAPSSAFHDVRPPSSLVGVTNPSGSELVVFDSDSSLYAAKNYDDVTGRGSPYVPLLIIAESTPTHRGVPTPVPPGWYPA